MITALTTRGARVRPWNSVIPKYRYYLRVNSFPPLDLLFQCPNPTQNSGYHVKRVDARIACVLVLQALTRSFHGVKLVHRGSLRW